MHSVAELLKILSYRFWGLSEKRKVKNGKKDRERKETEKKKKREKEKPATACKYKKRWQPQPIAPQPEGGAQLTH